MGPADVASDQGVVPSGASKALAAVAHLSLFWFFLGGALILFRWPGRHEPYVRTHSGEAFDFQVTFYIGGLALVALGLTGGAATSWSSSIQDLFFWWFFPIWFVWIVGAYVLSVRAAVRSVLRKNSGYPPTLRVLRRRQWPDP